MSRVFVVALLCAASARAEIAGAALSPTVEVRGPFRHVVAGASLVRPDGAVLDAAQIRVAAAPNARAVRSVVVWAGSGAAPDVTMELSGPGFTKEVDAERCITAADGPLVYWQCRAELGPLDAFAGTWEVSGVDVDTADPWRAAEGFAGAAALVFLYATPGDDAPRVVQLSEGLLWSRQARTASQALLPFTLADGDDGKLSVVALEGDRGLPGDGMCDGTLEDDDCDFVGLCDGASCDVLAEVSAGGDVFNESAGDALDVDTFSLAGLLAPGRYAELRSFTQTGADAVVQVLSVVDVPDFDFDGDRLSDDAEAALGTSPVDPDSDGDGVLDGVEVYGGNPAASGSTPTDPLDPDSDDDGLLDGEEDLDHDGIFDAGETSTLDADSDDDGLLDGIEVLSIYPGDRCPNGGTNPLDPDTDNDGKLDGEEDPNGDGVVADDETSPCAFDFTPDLPEDSLIPDRDDVVLPPPPVEENPDDEPTDDQPTDDEPTDDEPTDDEPTVDPSPAPSPPGSVIAKQPSAPDGTLSGSTIWGCSTGAGATPWFAGALLFLALRRGGGARGRAGRRA